MFRELRAKGVKVTVLTNSLASTDEPVVHIGYAAHREELLHMGIDLYELSSSRPEGQQAPVPVRPGRSAACMPSWS